MDPKDLNSLDESPADAPESDLPLVLRPLPALPVAVRLILLVVGWLLLLVGIAGLVLPGIQGILTLVLAAAVLSLVSEFVYRLLRRGLHRWPTVWNRVERFRSWLHDKLSPRRD